MPVEPDHDPAATPEPPPPAAPPQEPEPDDDGGSADAHPQTPDARLSALYRQWRALGRPEGEALTLLRTTPGTPNALPYLDLLGVGSFEIEDAWEEWNRAQLASDATPLGRILRPVVALVPWGGRWTVARSIGRTCALEPIDHATPAQALAAAQARLELVAARRLGEPLDDLAAEIEADEQATSAATGAHAPTGAPTHDTEEVR